MRHVLNWLLLPLTLPLLFFLLILVTAGEALHDGSHYLLLRYAEFLDYLEGAPQ